MTQRIKIFYCNNMENDAGFLNVVEQRNWDRKLFNNQKGKLFDNKKEKLFDKPSFSNQPQPTPNPIRDRSGRPDNRKGGRNTSRSQEISVNSFNEELSSSKQGDLLKQR